MRDCEATAARLRDALLGGGENFRRDQALAAAVEGIAPGTGRLIRAALAFHAHAAEEAVTDGGATGVVFARGGYPPPPPDLLPHQRASELSPRARYLYAPDNCVIAAVTRRALMLLGDSRAGVAEVPASDPEAVIGAAAEHGLGGRLSVHLILAAQCYPPQLAAEVVAGYAKRLPAGSSLVLSLRSFSASPEGEALMAVLEAGGLPVWAHAPQDVAGWLAGGGMEVTAGTADVRLLAGGRWAGGRLAVAAAGPVIGAAARVPGRDGPGGCGGGGGR
jgi:S-adenosyl methyltransferase